MIDFGLLSKCTSFNIDPVDFSHTAVVENNTCEGFGGSFGYTAPELFSNRPYDGKKADVFALGTLFYNVVFRRMPFCASYFDAMKNAYDDENSALPKLPILTSGGYCPVWIWEMIVAMLDENPNKRPFMDDLFTHVYERNKDFLPEEMEEIMQERDFMFDFEAEIKRKKRLDKGTYWSFFRPN